MKRGMEEWNGPHELREHFQVIFGSLNTAGKEMLSKTHLELPAVCDEFKSKANEPYA